MSNHRGYNGMDIEQGKQDKLWKLMGTLLASRSLREKEMYCTIHLLIPEK
jgi:hypothetical protein